MRGLFIVIEGGDRSGKSTLAKSLSASIDGSHLGSFPDRSTPIGQLINAHLKGQHSSPQTIHLLFSANRHEAAPNLLSLLNAGHTVVLDRYVPSGIAYSMAKGLDGEWCQAADMGLPKPDAVLFVDLPVEVAAARAGYGEEVYEKKEFQQKVREAFLKLKDDSWRSIDGTKSQEEMLKDALFIIKSLQSSSSISFY